MRIAATFASVLFAFAACSSTSPSTTEDPYIKPNSLMAGEIVSRVQQIPFQHREELWQNLVWLTDAGEQVIPTVLEGLKHENAKVRSSCAWVLGQLHDRRTIPALRAVAKDSEASVRTEVARTLVMLGDLQSCPTLIEGLDSDKREVRYMCHEALKVATGHDFGYDHLNTNRREMQTAVLRWRQWWGEYSGDSFFAQKYQQQNGLDGVPAVPAGETRPNTDGSGSSDASSGSTSNPSNPSSSPSNNTGNSPVTPKPNTNPGNGGTSDQGNRR